MKRIYKTSVKLVMMLIASVCVLGFLTAMLLLVSISELDGYHKSPETIEKTLQHRANENYAIWAIANYHGGYSGASSDIDLTKTNACYGVIEGATSVEGLDLNAADTYVDRNFDGPLPEDYDVFYYNIGERSVYNIGTSLLYGTYFYPGETTHTENVDVQGIGYDAIDKIFYIWTGEDVFPVDDENIGLVDNTDVWEDEEMNICYRMIWENQRTKATGVQSENGEEQATVSNDLNDLLYFNGVGYEPMSKVMKSDTLWVTANEETGYISLDYVANLTDDHERLTHIKKQPIQLQTISRAIIDVPNESTAQYAVVCFPKAKLDTSGGWFHGDYYTQAKLISDVIPVGAVLLPIGMLVFFGIGVWMICLVLCASGHVYGSEELQPKFLDRIPVDLMFAFACILEFLWMCAIAALIETCTRGKFLEVSVVFIIICVLGASVTGIIWLMTLACNIKLGHWWNNTLIAKSWHMISAWYGRRRNDIRTGLKHIKWSKRIWLLFAILAFCEFFGIAVIDRSEILLLIWLIEKVAFAVGLIWLMKHYGNLKKTMLAISSGDTSARVNTTGMPIDFEEQGNALNEIASGLNVALTERVKSERMKTELITNVSHDIKTPLTSIINYVDLLEKQQIENEEAKEYLEVLERQSKRLKKLIEDLIEASKAATGNIKFQMESVNARMILNQSIGEFADRLKENDITLISNVPESDLYVWADNRYLWRVFDNLMSNIAKYAQSGTRAYVDLKQQDDTVTFTFRNTSKQELNISADELMERFVRGDASRNTEGNGLGLSIAQSLTESMEGTMNIAIDGDLFKVILTFRVKA